MTETVQPDAHNESGATSILLRRVAVVLVIFAGMSLFFYGALVNSHSVLVEQSASARVSSTDSSLPSSAQPGVQPAPEQPGAPHPAAPGPGAARRDEEKQGAPEPGPSAPQFATVTKNEPAVVRDVTVGGLMLLPDGRMKQTYLIRPASACPT